MILETLSDLDETQQPHQRRYIGGGGGVEHGGAAPEATNGLGPMGTKELELTRQGRARLAQAVAPRVGLVRVVFLELRVARQKLGL